LKIDKMNDNEKILAELQKLGAWADLQRRITKWSFIVMAILIPALIVFGIMMGKRFQTSMEEVSSGEKPEKPDWGEVDWKTRHGNFDEAIRVGEELIQGMPQYPEGHHRLASAYLAAGKIEQAREHYAQAFRLFPSEENEKLLIAIDRRIKEGNLEPGGAASGKQPVRSETNRTSRATGSRP
jgi:tetratricopeptide (TPR) repeat protein